MEETLATVEHMALCPGCQKPRDRRQPACPHCGRLQVPPHEEWGKAFKRWLVLEVLAAKVQAYHDATLQFLWERILQDAAMLRPGSVVRRADPAPELYVTLRQEFDRALDAGGLKPPRPFRSANDV